MFNKKLFIICLFFNITACTSQYAPLIKPSNHKSGYTEQLLTNESNNEAVRYLLTYQGTVNDSEKRITTFWHQRAKELCPQGYNVEYHKQTIVHGSIRSPINGIMVTLGTLKPLDSGIIECFKSNEDIK